jgi:hypothetical protein
MLDQLRLTLKWVKENNELRLVNSLSNVYLKHFVESLEEGQEITVTYEVLNPTGSYAQLSKVHKCVRELATFTGNTFEDMKLQIKIRSGLCTSEECKSFADCSTDELSLAIQAAIEIGDIVGFNLH